MSKIGLIIKREYLRRVSKKSFILLTFLTPFLFAALAFVPLWLSSIKGDEVHTVAILDATGKYAPLFEDTESYRFINGDKDMDKYRQMSEKEIFAFLNISDDLQKNPKNATLYSKKQIPADLSRLVNMTLKKQIESDKLATFNIPNLQEIIKESKVDFNIQTIKWGDDGSEKQSSSVVASIIGGIFTMLIYMFIMIYGAMVMQGVMEEKTNRIIEIMISSVKPFDLMMGKIIGIGFVGLTQVFLWAIMTLILIAGGSFLVGGGIDNEMVQSGMALNTAPDITMMSAQQPSNEWIEMLGTINFAEIGILFVVYFIGGYLLYSSLFAAIRFRRGQPRRYATIHATGNAPLGIRSLCGNLQYGKSRRASSLLVLHDPIYLSDRDDGAYAFRGSFMANRTLHRIALSYGDLLDLDLLQDIPTLGISWRRSKSSRSP